MLVLLVLLLRLHLVRVLLACCILMVVEEIELVV